MLEIKENTSSKQMANEPKEQGKEAQTESREGK
jgi:hypothetical protein